MTGEVSSAPSPADVAAQTAERTFTQAEVNEIVQNRLKNMKAEYEQLQARAASVEDLESRNQQLSSDLSSLQLESLRMRVASEFGISADDRDILLTATDEETLRMQAERFATFPLQRAVGGNVARREGRRVEAPSAMDGSTREFVRELFGHDPLWD